MRPIESFRDLIVWQEAMHLVEDVYALTKTFPGDERYGLSLQMRRTAVSIPSNIAEGFRRWREKAYPNHVSIALGSQGEMETQIEIAIRLQYVTPSGALSISRRAEQVGKMLHGLLRSLERSRQ